MIESVKWVQDNIEVKFIGECGFDEISRINNLVYSDVRFDEMKYQIFDFSEVSRLNLTIEEVKIIGVLDKNASHWNNELIVAIVLIDDVMKKLALEYGRIVQSGNWSTYVFQSYIEAKNFCESH